MTVGPHTMTRASFEALARGGGGEAVVRQLVAAQRSKNLLLIRAVLDSAGVAGRQHQVSAAYDLLARVHRLAPHAAETVIRHPAVGAWALGAIQNQTSAEACAQPEWLAAVAAAAAIRGRVPCTIELPYQTGDEAAIVLPSLGRAVFPAPLHRPAVLVQSQIGGARIVLADAHIAIPPNPQRDAPAWHGIRSISAVTDSRRIDLLLDDQDPHRFPGGAARRGHLSGAEFEVWRKVVSDGWRILARQHPRIAAEVSTAITVLTPLSAPVGELRSATAREAFGCIALSLPHDGTAMALTMAHEVQHAKLTALMDLFPMIESGDTALYYAPWHPDPRPPAALLQGTYAYLGVTDFWRRQRHCETDASAALRAHAEFARWREAARDIAELLLCNGRLTSHGRLLAAGMLHSLRRWCSEAVPPEAGAAGRRAAERHRAQWLRRNGIAS
jgi:HEXXH motif-containing protein